MKKKIKKEEKKEGKKIDDEIPEINKHPKVDVNVHTLDNSSLKDLVEKNIKWSQIIYEQNRKIKHRLTLMVVGSYLRLAIIVIPIILGLIYLPPLAKDLWEQYNQVLGGATGGSLPINEIINSISGEQINEILKSLQP